MAGEAEVASAQATLCIAFGAGLGSGWLHSQRCMRDLSAQTKIREFLNSAHLLHIIIKVPEHAS